MLVSSIRWKLRRRSTTTGSLRVSNPTDARRLRGHLCGRHPGYSQIQLPMHVRPGGNSHSSPSPRNSDWLSAEPSSQSHLRRAALWQRIYGQWFASHNIFLERYVDNRFVIFPSPASGHPAAPLEALLHADFYGAPIVLEQVGSSEFLGFVIDVGDRAIYYKTPTKIWQIRGPHTAGSLSTLLSGARSRSALATKYAHPARAVQMALDQLRSMYLSAGYKSADLQHSGHPNRKECLCADCRCFLRFGCVALAGSVRFGSFPNGVGLGWAAGLGFSV